MSWRERIASLSLGRLFKGETRTALPIEMAMSLGVNTTGVTVTEKSVLTLAVAFACINVISTDLSSLPLTLYRKRKSGGRDIIDDHDAAYKLRWSPDENDDTSSVKLRQDWTAHTLGWGNGYLNVDRSGDGTIKELSLLDPQYTQAMRRKTDQRLFYRLKDGTTRTPDNILHLAGLGLDGVTGYSPPKLCKQAYALGLAMEIYGASFYGNGAIAGGWIKIPGKRKPEVLANLRRSVEGVHRGPYNAGRIGLLEEGMDFQSTSISPEDAQFLTGRQFQAIEICRIYRVPPHKVGDYSQAHLANVEISNLDYITTTLRPWAVATETTCSLKLLSQKERRKGLYFEHQMTALLRGDMKSRVEYYTRMRDSGSLCPDEIRDMEGLNPIEGGIGKIYLVPVNLQTLEKAAKEPEPAPAAGDGLPSANGENGDQEEGKEPAAAEGSQNGNGNGNGKAKTGTRF